MHGAGAHPGQWLHTVTPMYRGRRQTAQTQPRTAERQPRHAPWVAIYEAVRTLQAQGTPMTTIARQLGISRPTIYAYLRRAADAGQSPEPQGSLYTRPHGPSARAMSFAMVCPAAKRSRKAQTYMAQLC